GPSGQRIIVAPQASRGCRSAERSHTYRGNSIKEASQDDGLGAAAAVPARTCASLPVELVGESRRFRFLYEKTVACLRTYRTAGVRLPERPLARHRGNPARDRRTASH